MKIFKRLFSIIIAFNLLIVSGIEFVFGSVAFFEDDSIIESNDYDLDLYEESFAEDRFIVVLNNQVSKQLQEYNADDFSEIEIASIRDLTQSVKTELKISRDSFEESGLSKSATVDSQLNFNNYHQILSVVLEYPGKENVLTAIERIKNREDVLYAGPDYIIEVSDTTPNDKYYSIQSAPEIIDLPKSWDITTGSSNVMVGVVDTGIDGTHPDLNAKIDTTLCRDFSSGTMQTVSVPTDPNGHGTHVAGIIGSIGNNAVGVAGVCWNIKLVSLRVFNNAGQGYSSNAIAAIAFATANNIPILNFSARWYEGSQRYDVPMDMVLSNYPGLFVCAAGNEGIDNDSNNIYPANIDVPNLISVANTTPSDMLFSYVDNGEIKGSNYGANTVHLAAPGTTILSCYPTSKCSDGTHKASTHYANGYHYNTGTSMAAPHVAGVAALIKSYNPNLSAIDIKRLILENVDVVSSLNGKCITGGRLNAYKALYAATQLEEKPAQRFVGMVSNDFSEDIVEVRAVGEHFEMLTYLAYSDGSLLNLTPVSSDNSTPKKYYRTVTDFEYDTDYDISVLSGDINNDRYMDIVFVYAGVGRAGKRNITVYFGSTDGTGIASDESNGRFDYSVTVETSNSADTELYPSKYFVADANGDDRDDLIVMYKNPGGVRSILVYASNGSMLSSAATSTETSHTYVESDPVFVGDVNGDWKADFIIHWASNNQRRLTVLTSLGTSYATQGNTLVTTNSTLASYCSQFTVCDMNGDYNDDFVVVYKSSDACFAQLAYLGGGSETSASLSQPVRTNTTIPFYDILSISSGDINCNQCEDVVVEYANSNVKRCLTVFYGNFEGAFTNKGTYVSVNSANAATYDTETVYGDFLGDGGMDVIAIWTNKTATSKIMNYITYASRGSAISATSLVPYYSKKSGSINVPYYAYG